MADNYPQENRQIWTWIKDEGHAAFLHQAAECDAFVRGEQWDTNVVHELRRRKKPVLTLNVTLATYAALFGNHLSRQGDVTFRPTAGGSIETARSLDKLWLHFTQSQHYDWIEAMAFTDGIIRSRGFVDLRVSFDDSMQAEPVITYLNSKDVGLYPGDYGLDPDNWTGVMVSKWMTARDIAEIYKQDPEEVLREAESSDIGADFLDWKRDAFGSPMYSDPRLLDETQRMRYRMFRVLERQEWEYRTIPCFVEPISGEVREIPTAWDRERVNLAMAQYGYRVINKRMKKINWLVSVGQLGLHKSISPYKHFTPVPYFPFFVGGRPLGVVEHLRDPQRLLNKSMSQQLHIAAGIANSGYVVRTGSLTNMTTEQLEERGGEDGIVIESTGGVADVQKIQPNQVPSGLDRLSYMAGDLMQRISLVSDSLQGMNRPDESGRAIDQKAQLNAGALSPVYAALDTTRRIVARNWLDLVQEFITEPRVYYITSRARFADPQQVQVNQPQFDGSFLNDLTIGEYSVTITSTRERSTADMEQFDLMMQMVREGAPIPWSDIVANLTILDNRQDVIDFLKAQEGRTDPTEQDQQRSQLELRMLAAQAADKEGSAAVKQAQAQKAQVEASKSANGVDPVQAELARDQAMFSLKQQELDAQLQRDAQKNQLTMAAEQAKLYMQQAVEESRQALEANKAELELYFSRQKAQLDLEVAQALASLEIQRKQMDIELAQTKARMQEVQMEHQKKMLSAKEKELQADSSSTKEE